MKGYFVATPSQYPHVQRFDFSISKDERAVIKAYKEQLGKTKHHKFVTYSKSC